MIRGFRPSALSWMTLAIVLNTICLTLYGTTTISKSWELQKFKSNAENRLQQIERRLEIENE